MTDFLEALEQQLIDALEQHAAETPMASRSRVGCATRACSRRLRASRGRRVTRRGIWRRVAVGALFGALAAGLALVAFGAPGAGPHARAPEHSSAGAVREPLSRGLPARGLPSLGHSRLASLEVADPVAGARWGMRIVHTPTNLVCLQIGQLERGRLRPLDGVEGDGVVHMLPPPAQPPGAIGNGLVESQLERAAPHGPNPPYVEDCKPAGATFIGYGSAGAMHAPSGSRPGGHSPLRTIAFGLLGPDAVSITYRFRGRLRSRSVESGTGAYLIVLPGTAPRAIVAVGYRVGAAVCEQATERVASAPVLADRCPAR